MLKGLSIKDHSVFFSGFCKIVYQWVMTNCCFMSDVFYAVMLSVAPVI